MNVLAKLSYIVFVGTNIMEQKVTGRIIDLNCVIPCSYQVPTKSLPDMDGSNQSTECSNHFMQDHAVTIEMETMDINILNKEIFKN